MNSNDTRVVVGDNTTARYEQAMAFLEKLIEYVDDVDTILKNVADHYNADRAYVFEFSEDGSTLDNIYEWCREGVTPQIESLQKVPAEAVAVWVEEFKQKGAFVIASLEEDVDTDSLTYEILKSQDIESLIAVPIYKDGKLIGLLGVDNPDNNLDDITVLKVTASILYSEISRKIASKNQALVEMTEAQIKQNDELREIRDIISSANMGTWRIELVENEEPKMYADDTMRRLLGIEGLELSPEKIYDEWFYNITPEAVQSVMSSVERMQQGFFDENTYLWKHPTKGIRYVRCGGTAKSIPGGSLLQGYHYDVDEVVRKSQAQTLKLKKALEDRKGYYEALSALGDIFYSMHVIDLKKDTADELTARNEVKKIANHRDGAAEMMRQVMNAVISAEYTERALEFTDLSTVADRMQNKAIISIELLGRNVGWVSASFITMETDSKGRPVKVIYTTRVIDEEKKQREKLIQNSQTDELTGLDNRRAFEEKLRQHNNTPEEDEFVYVSIDVNGLKVVNDTLGHAAGDELIIGVAECMRKSMGDYGYLYRIGGDEFVAILFCSEGEIRAVMAEFDSLVENWKGELVDKIEVSYGWVSKHEMPGKSVLQLGMAAEKRMYEAKDVYYRTKGVDRRGQRDAHRMLCELYTKILKINITNDTYQIINMNEDERNAESGFSETISGWITSFGKAGFVHPDDLEEYLRLTDLKYLREYFMSGKRSLIFFYRRKYRDGFKKSMMEIVPANDYIEDNMSLFLYVKNIDN